MPGRARSRAGWRQIRSLTMIEILFVASSTAPASAKMSRLRRGATHHPAAAIRRRRCLENLRPTELLRAAAKALSHLRPRELLRAAAKPLSCLWAAELLRAAAKPLGNLWSAELLGPTAKSFG
jgi:hypothetical protein